MSNALTLEMVDGVAVLTFDLKGESINKFSPAVIDEFTATIERLEQDPSVKAAVLLSGKPGTFIAGADIDQFLAFKTAEDARKASAFGHVMMTRIEKGRVPVVAAIEGACLGGGLEFALACAYRIAADTPKTVLALGDSFHDSRGAARIGASDAKKLAQIAETVDLVWVLGNHDPTPDRKSVV